MRTIDVVWLWRCVAPDGDVALALRRQIRIDIPSLEEVGIEGVNDLYVVSGVMKRFGWERTI